MGNLSFSCPDVFSQRPCNSRQPYPHLILSHNIWSLCKAWTCWCHFKHNGTVDMKIFLLSVLYMALQWRHNERNEVSNHQPRDCLLNRLFKARSKKTSKLRVTGLCEGNSPGTGEFPAERPGTRKMFPIDDVITVNVNSGTWPVQNTGWSIDMTTHAMAYCVLLHIGIACASYRINVKPAEWHE